MLGKMGIHCRRHLRAKTALVTNLNLIKYTKLNSQNTCLFAYVLDFRPKGTRKNLKKLSEKNVFLFF